MFIAYFAPVFLSIPLENSFNRLQLLLNKKQMLIPPLSSMRKLAPVVVPGSRCQWCRSLGARCDPGRVNIALAPHSSSSSSSSSYTPPVPSGVTVPLPEHIRPGGV